ncbi:MAG: phosphoadenosine phosphosulfate reductase family protein [Bacteroidetes bacterium]|nr:phosphoadenosine phosphosulfate reductase family protein [Bacteroidota bacterium]
MKKRISKKVLKNNLYKQYTNQKKDIICWWSGGVTSAVACKLAIDIYGKNRCRIIMIDTKNEDDDTYRFKQDCEKWYSIKIESLTAIGVKYDSIEDVWFDYESLNVAKGAICSSELKRAIRLKFQKENNITHQVFGFDISEPNRAKNIKRNYPDSKPIFPLLMYGYSKKETISILEENNIEIPRVYKFGFNNNNCFKTGCVQGGIGYWYKMKREFPDKFDKMAAIEHELTELKGEPVTMLKDQSKGAKESGNVLVFLKPHRDYPNLKDLSMMKGREPEPLVECNGFCGDKNKPLLVK